MGLTFRPPVRKDTTTGSQGVCPVCGQGDAEGVLEYGVIELVDGEQLYYPVHCTYCGADFKEWYELKYTETEYSPERE